MTYDDACTYLELQGRAAGLPHEATDWLVLLHKALQDLSSRYDMDAFLRHSDALFVTSAGVETYSLPDDFQRRLMPKHDRQTGIRLWDGATEGGDLDYREPFTWHDQRATTQGRPSTFTILGRELWLSPLPDSNNGANYVGRGLYVATIPRPALDDLIPVADPSALVDYVLAAAQGSPPLQNPGLNVLVNNQAKRKQAFFRSRERWGQWSR